MTPPVEAHAAIARLLAEIDDDLASAAQRLASLRGFLDPSRPDAAHVATVAAAALDLHHYYTAIESALERVGRAFEGSLPHGADWHRELLHASVLDLPGVRPPVLRRDTEAELRRLLSFRHFLRHAYAVELDAHRVVDLAGLAVRASVGVLRDFDAFRAHLAASLQALERG